MNSYTSRIQTIIAFKLEHVRGLGRKQKKQSLINFPFTLSFVYEPRPSLDYMFLRWCGDGEIRAGEMYN